MDINFGDSVPNSHCKKEKKNTCIGGFKLVVVIIKANAKLPIHHYNIFMLYSRVCAVQCTGIYYRNEHCVIINCL